MKHLFRVSALLATMFATAAPALAQPIALPPGSPPGQTVMASEGPALPIPESGTANYRLEVRSYGCVLPEWTVPANRDPFPVAGPCDEALPFNAVFYGGSRLRLEVDRTGKCLASPPDTGIYGRVISILPCTGGLEQRYHAEETRIPGFVRLRAVSGQCLTMARSISAIGESKPYMAEKACDDERGQFFKLARIYPAGYIAPADPSPGGAYPGTTSGSRLGMATPVVPAGTAPGGPFVPTRPAGLPENMPAPAAYWLTPGGGDGQCYRGVAAGALWTPRIAGDGCRDTPDSLVRLTHIGTRGFQLSYGEPNLCFTTSSRPWITLAPCAVASEQFFQIVRADYPRYYVIKTQAGLCLTQRGAPNPDSTRNNSALFPEPCREAPEQYFDLYPVLE